MPYNDLEFARTATGLQEQHASVLGGAYLASVHRLMEGLPPPRLRLVRQAGEFVAPEEPELSVRILMA